MEWVVTSAALGEEEALEVGWEEEEEDFRWADNKARSKSSGEK